MIRQTLALTVLVFGLAACNKGPQVPTASQPAVAPAASQAPGPKQTTAADLKKLHWIEGTWRGTGGGVATFYERYKFENDATLVVETLTDETLSKVEDTSRFELKDGSFGHSEAESGSVATELDDRSITFAPLGKARNSFRWERESENSWQAVLKWTDANGAAQERTYQMERWPQKAQP